MCCTGANCDEYPALAFRRPQKQGYLIKNRGTCGLWEIYCGVPALLCRVWGKETDLLPRGLLRRYREPDPRPAGTWDQLLLGGQAVPLFQEERSVRLGRLERALASLRKRFPGAPVRPLWGGAPGAP